MPTLISEYRKVRKGQIAHATETGQRSWGKGAAFHALQVARSELLLQAAENEGRIRFRWVQDEDYVPENSGDPDWGDKDLANEYAKLNNGEWEALGCIVQVPNLCTHCGMPSDDNAALESYWHDAGVSLWGIVIDASDTYDYRREVERDLASEAGVLS